MPSQAEVIQALHNAGLGQMPPPQSPASVTAGAAPFAAALGLPDALKALRGEFTPEEAKGFALTSAMGLLPGAKAESAAVKTMGELLPHYYPAGSSFAKMTPKDYLLTMGEGLPKQLPPDLQKVLAPELKNAKVPGPGPVKVNNPPVAATLPEKTFGELYPNDYLPDNPISKMTHSDIQAGIDSKNPAFLKFLKNNPSVSSQNISKTPAQLAKEQGQIYPPISETAISNALAKNPGASIFDVANTHIGGQSSPLSSAMGNAGLEQTFPQQLFRDIPREGGIQYTPTKASILGRSENLVHGTRVPQSKWSGGIGTETDALKLPDDELGVHFGNPKQAQVFSGDWLSHQAAPRQYPVVVSTNNPLELPDLGTWHLEDITSALDRANRGDLRGRAGVERRPDNPSSYMQLSPETEGMFPPHEVNQLDSIEDARNYLSSKGYDSIKYVNKAEDSGNNSYIKFTPSPEAPNFVTGVRSPFAAFDPAKIMRPELAAGIGGAAALSPQGQEYIQALQNGGQQNQ
jgi:hypothetical protein